MVEPDDGIHIEFVDSATGPSVVEFADTGGVGYEDPGEGAVAHSGPAPGDAASSASVVRPRQPQVMPIRQEPSAESETPLFDWLTEVAIPLGIFGLLGCLLYFLIDLRAALGGEFSSGLRWVCFWFLLAAILITRIRTKYGGAALALPYVLALAAATGLFVWQFTFRAGALAERYTASGALFSLLFNLSLVGLVWWAAYKVTRECTLEENVLYSLGQGFFAELTGGKAQETAHQTAARHPGRVILWVSLAAVLIFGLGARTMGDQSRLAPHAFWCMAGYVFFALFLLALTNLSAIRMDVRQRKVQVSRALVPTWIATSLVIVLLIAAVAALIPRPRSGAGRKMEMGERAAWLRPPDGRGWNWGPASGLGEPPSDSASSPGRQAETVGEGLPADQGNMGQAGSGGAVGRGGQGASGGGQGGGTSRAGGPDQNQQAGGGGGSGESADSSASRSRGGGPTVSWWWLILLLLLLAILAYLLVRYRKQIMPFLRTLAAPFRALWFALVAFLQRLRRWLGLGRRPRSDEWADLPEDPFADIWEQRELGANMTPAQIVRHVYRAFLAFCHLRGHPRPEYSTEFEFLRMLPPRIGLPEEDQRNLTWSYVFATYSPNEVSTAAVELVRDIWSRLRPAIDSTLATQARQAS